MATPPHLADLTLTYATAERSEEFIAATLRGFYHDYEPDGWGPGKGVLEPDRNFGFTVDDRWVTTCAAYSRTMTVPGGSVPVAAVTYVTVQPAYRRRGLLSQMMRHQLDDIVGRGEPVALLWASETAIYGRYGYGGATPFLSISGATPATAYRAGVDLGGGSVGEVEVQEWRSVVEELHARLLPERPGALSRSSAWWDFATNDHPSRRHGAAALRYLLHYDAAGEPDGYLAFRPRALSSGTFEPGVEVRVTCVDAAGPAAYARLWRFVLDLDLVRSFKADVALDDPLRLLVADERSVSAQLVDGTYVRLVDLPRALEARRYAAEVDLVLGVRDPMLPQNEGAFRLQGGKDGAVVRRVSTEPDVCLDVRDLGAIYLGGRSPATLQRAGLVSEQTPGSVPRLAAAFGWPRLPLCLDFF